MVTPSLYVMPDRFPTVPGHVLIISRDHLACFASAPGPLLDELDALTELVRCFVRDTYGSPSRVWENGITGQTVGHAHLHVLPVPADAVPPELDTFPGVSKISDWRAVRDHLTRHGGYRYADFSGNRRLIADDSPAIHAMTTLLGHWTGLHRGPDGWVKTTDERDVRETERRWQVWSDRRRTLHPPTQTAT